MSSSDSVCHPTPPQRATRSSKRPTAAAAKKAATVTTARPASARPAPVEPDAEPDAKVRVMDALNKMNKMLYASLGANESPPPKLTAWLSRAIVKGQTAEAGAIIDYLRAANHHVPVIIEDRALEPCPSDSSSRSHREIVRVHGPLATAFREGNIAIFDMLMDYDRSVSSWGIIMHNLPSLVCRAAHLTGPFMASALSNLYDDGVEYRTVGDTDQDEYWEDIPVFRDKILHCLTAVLWNGTADACEGVCIAARKAFGGTIPRHGLPHISDVLPVTPEKIKFFIEHCAAVGRPVIPEDLYRWLFHDVYKTIDYPSHIISVCLQYANLAGVGDAAIGKRAIGRSAYETLVGPMYS